MSKELSKLKVKKLLSLHLSGLNQTEISKELHISQPTVSNYVGQFESLKKQIGVEAALAHFEVAYNPKDDQKMIQELYSSDLTTADLNIALQTNNLLNACGVNPADRHDLILSMKKAQEGEYVDAALHLHSIEKQTGMNYGQIVSYAEKKIAQLKQTEGKIAAAEAHIGKLNTEIAQKEKTKIQASAGLKAHLEQTGLTNQRILKIEKLAVVLKEAGIPDEVIIEYIARQLALNKAGIKIDLFAVIAEKAKVATKSDGGKKLLALLDQYGNLTEVNNQLKAENDYLSKEAVQIEPKAKQKKALEKDIATLESARAKLEPEAAKLAKQIADLQNTWSQLMTANHHMTGVNGSLEQHQKKLLATIGTLDKEIEAKTGKVKDLDTLAAQRDEAENQLKELNNRKMAEGRSWQVYEGLMGIIQAKSRDDLKKALSLLPSLLEEVDENEYSPDLLRNMILQDLEITQVAKCSCGASFFIDKPAPSGGYRCPRDSFGELHQISVIKQTVEVFNKALAGLKPKGTAIVPATKIELKSGPKLNNQPSSSGQN